MQWKLESQHNPANTHLTDLRYLKINTVPGPHPGPNVPESLGWDLGCVLRWQDRFWKLSETNLSLYLSVSSYRWEILVCRAGGSLGSSCLNDTLYFTPEGLFTIPSTSPNLAPTAWSYFFLLSLRECPLFLINETIYFCLLSTAFCCQQITLNRKNMPKIKLENRK